MLADGFDAKTRQTLCTQAGGFASTLLFYPIDTVRFRAMSHDNTGKRLHHDAQRYRGVLPALRLVVRHEGAAALFRGCPVALGGATASWGIYVYAYRTLQEAVQRATGQAPSFATDCAASTAASVFNAFVTTPIWHVKTRMQLEDTTASAGAERRYRGFARSLAAVARADGTAGLWRGFSAQVLMSAANGVYFPVYQRLLAAIRAARAPGGSAAPDAARGNGAAQRTGSSLDVAAASMAAKSLIAMVTNPLFVLRTRLQDERHSLVASVAYRHFAQSVRLVWREEGVAGFYRGVRATLLVTAPKSMVTMVVAERLYELTSKPR
jgi:solute carrier family 25 folate transporter 32